jgi:hypothetical protein
MKRIILLVVVVAVVIGGWYAYHSYSRKNPDLSTEEASERLAAPALIAAFSKDTAGASKQYVNKIVAVTGTVKKIDANGNPVVIFLGTGGEMSSVKCSMDSTHAQEYKSVKEGSDVTIKGRCTGGVTDDMFGTDVTLNYCVLDTKK